MSINTSFLTSTRFGIAIDSDEFKDVEMAIMSWPHPGVTRPAATASARTQNVPYQGSRIQFEDLTVRVQLDGGMNNYWSLYDWLLSESQKDVILTAYSSNDKPTTQIRYRDAFVESIGGIEFAATDQSDDVIAITVTFKYTMFEKV